MLQNYPMSRLFNLFAILFLATAFHAKAQYSTVWKTDNVGNNASNQIMIPATGTKYSIVIKLIAPHHKAITL